MINVHTVDRQLNVHNVDRQLNVHKTDCQLNVYVAKCDALGSKSILNAMKTDRDRIPMHF